MPLLVAGFVVSGERVNERCEVGAGNGCGVRKRVSGAGVVGDQPRLSPGDSYQYTSGCPLATPSGIMVGTYTMRSRTGELFEVAIPAFSLDLPGTMRTVN